MISVSIFAIVIVIIIRVVVFQSLLSVIICVLFEIEVQACIAVRATHIKSIISYHTLIYLAPYPSSMGMG